MHARAHAHTHTPHTKKIKSFLKPHLQARHGDVLLLITAFCKFEASLVYIVGSRPVMAIESVKNKQVNKIDFLLFILFCFSRQNYSVYPWLSWNLL